MTDHRECLFVKGNIDDRGRTQHEEQVGQDGADEAGGHDVVQAPVQSLLQSKYMISYCLRCFCYVLIHSVESLFSVFH